MAEWLDAKTIFLLLVALNVYAAIHGEIFARRRAAAGEGPAPVGVTCRCRLLCSLASKNMARATLAGFDLSLWGGTHLVLAATAPGGQRAPVRTPCETRAALAPERQKLPDSRSSASRA
jgi:hypothetical protein